VKSKILFKEANRLKIGLNRPSSNWKIGFGLESDKIGLGESKKVEN